MNNFELYTPVKVVFGKGEGVKAPSYAMQYGKRVMIISYSPRPYLKDLIDNIMQSLKNEGAHVTEFFQVQANPTISCLREGVALCKAEKTEVIIAIGGGSVMDAAKGIAAGSMYDGDVWELFASRHHKQAVTKAALPTVMIPTMAATSSEMNAIGVATNEELQEKTFIKSPHLYPKVAILDPSLTCSISPYQTACGVADAISHVMEAYLNGDLHSPIHDRLQEGLIIGLMDETLKVLKDMTNAEYRANIQWAATLCWNGWMQAGLNAATPVHKLGHAISARYNTTHGATMAIFMNAYFRYTAAISKERAERFAGLATRIFNISPQNKTKKQLSDEFIERFVRFLKEIGVPTTLTEAGVPADDLEAIADDVADTCGGTLIGWVPVDREGILEILKLAI